MVFIGLAIAILDTDTITVTEVSSKMGSGNVRDLRPVWAGTCDFGSADLHGFKTGDLLIFRCDTKQLPATITASSLLSYPTTTMRSSFPFREFNRRRSLLPQALLLRTVNRKVMLGGTSMVQLIDLIPKQFVSWRILLSQFMKCKAELSRRVSVTFLCRSPCFFLS